MINKFRFEQCLFMQVEIYTAKTMNLILILAVDNFLFKAKIVY